MKKNEKANIFFTFIIANMLITSIVISIAPTRQELSLIVSQLGLCLIPLLIYFYTTKESIIATLQFRKISIKTIILLIILCIFFQPTLTFFAYIMSLFFEPTVSQLIFDIKEAPVILLTISIAILPPLLEECIFRGVIFSNYKNCKPSHIIIASALLFSFFHFNLQQIAYTFVAGILFGYIVHITKSIWSPIICHLIINGRQLLAVLTVEAVEMESELALEPLQIGYILGIQVLVTLPICFLLLRAIKKESLLSKGQNITEPPATEHIATETPFTRIFLLNTAIYLLMMLLIYK